MDGKQFDSLTRALGAGRSRRGVLKGLGAAALGAAGLASLRGVTEAAAQPKVGICHRTGSASNPYEYITVAQSAVPAHRAHGDVIAPNFQTDAANCGGCGVTCDAATQTCAGGTCVDRCAGVDCSSQTSQCATGVCDPSTGTCSAQSANEGGACTDADNAAGTCQSGTCVVAPGLTVSFSPTGDSRYCLVDVTLVGLTPDTTYPVALDILDQGAPVHYDRTLTTDAAGDASGTPIGSYYNQNTSVQVSAAGLTSSRVAITC